MQKKYRTKVEALEDGKVVEVNIMQEAETAVSVEVFQQEGDTIECHACMGGRFNRKTVTALGESFAVLIYNAVKDSPDALEKMKAFFVAVADRTKSLVKGHDEYIDKKCVDKLQEYGVPEETAKKINSILNELAEEAAKQVTRD